MDLVRDLRFDGLFSFVYSPRKYTAASTLPNAVPRESALERLGRLQELQRAVTLEKNKATEGMIEEVLVEDWSKNSEKEMTGRTRTGKIVNFNGAFPEVGSLVEIEIVKGYANSLKGKVAKS
jgi:tRNA-2-methylthio-N6-dimethylallyladenosine synthase